MRGKEKVIVSLICLFFLLIAAAGCGGGPGQRELDSGEKKAALPLDVDVEFAAYQEEAVNCTPAVQPYTVKPGLGNIINKEMFDLSPEAERLLVE